MSRPLRLITAAAAGYALGSVPVGVLVGQVTKGIDVREHGSRSMGTTNVLRTVGPKPAAATLLLDIAKGVAAARIGRRVDGTRGCAVAGVGAVVGHSWPALAHFRGGKGVASAFGALIMVSPRAAGWAVVGGLTGLAATRRMSVGSMAGTLSSTAAAIGMASRSTDRTPLLFVVPIAGIVLVRHRENIDRLRRGVEPKIGQQLRAATG